MPADAPPTAPTIPTPPPLSAFDRPALFLDFDGTLVDIADHPDAVSVPPSLGTHLAGLSDALGGRIAIITGRSIAALEDLAGRVEIAIAGSHGGEFRPDATGAVDAGATPLPDEVTQQLRRFADDNGGLLVEPKPFSVAVHYRHHPDTRDALLEKAEQIAQDRDLGIKHGKQVVELTMPGSDKGSALRRFMALPRFQGAKPLFLGDDVTDEDGFRAAAELGGAGVLVGPARPTAAGYRLPDVAAVHAWLSAAGGPNPALTFTPDRETPA